MLWGMITINSLPSFWIGLVFLTIFAVQMKILPTSGALSHGLSLTGWAYTWDLIKHAIMPIMTLSLLSTPTLFMTMRYSMLSVLGEDFIRTARAKGLPERKVLFKHALRNALCPVATILALRLGYIFGGTTVTEPVFSYPGMGRLIFEAISGRDYPVMQAAFLLFTIAILLANLLADLVYPLIDPRAKV